MEILLFIALIILLFIVVTGHSRINKNTQRLTDIVARLTEEIRVLRKTVNEAPPPPAPPVAEASLPPIIITPAVAPPTPEPIPEVVTEFYSTPAEEPIDLFAEVAAFVEDEQAQASPVHPVTPPPVTPASPTYVPEESRWEKWLANNPDMEKFIGENLINKIGIAILVLGIAFFVKFAIDKDWINEAGRVGIGFGCGALLIGLGHYMRKKYTSFSSVLAGGGIAVQYFTVAFAFHQYALISQTTAFVLMIVVTGFAIALSLLYNRIELAVIATIGGFVTPFMVSTGSGNYVVLFSYLCILNAGLLTLAYFKRWTLINIIALAFTALMYGAWVGQNVSLPVVSFNQAHAMLFGTIFYILFLGMNMINQVRNKAAFKAFDFSVLLFINAAYFSAGMCILHTLDKGAYQGIFTIAMGLINMALAFYFYKRSDTERNLLFLLIGLTLTFISLAIPVQLHGHSITLFWSAEFVLLYWLYQKSRIVLFKYSSVLVVVLTACSIFIDWVNAGYNATTSLAVIYTNVTGLVTNLVLVAALVAHGMLLKKEEPGSAYLGILENRSVKNLSFFAAGLVLYLTCVFGVNLLLGKQDSYAIANVYHRLITVAFALPVWYRLQKHSSINALLVQGGILAALFLYYLSSIGFAAELRDELLANKHYHIHLLVHFIDIAALLFVFNSMIQYIRRHKEALQLNVKPAAWFITLAILTVFSVEFMHLYVMAAYKPGNIYIAATQYSKAGLSLLWGLSSFVMMLIGMRHQFKTLRIISLSVFTLTLMKLFMLDIRNLSEAGKIIAFISLGVLLLIVSFMYQRLKKIIL